ncbi:MAG: hypothetical protein PHR06_07995 [Candidatus Cloacimonetes bacterium]|nr:hypothetical protein [Candidatus Cloacimonadota bacterium]
MEISDLIPIARLGRTDESGYLVIKPYKIFKPELLELNHHFLFFSDNSVQLVKILDNRRKGNTYRISIENPEVLKEISPFDKVQLMVTESDYDDIFIDEEAKLVLNSEIIFNDIMIGVVTDIIDNGAHKILVVSSSGKEVMIPFVDFFVSEVKETEKKVFVRNIDDLLSL